MIAVQYSELVAAAQQAQMLDTLAADLLHTLAVYPLPAPLANAGLRFSHAAQPHQLTVRAHGKAYKARYDHVWLASGLPVPRLGGRIQFFDDASPGDAGAAMYEIVFDELGSARLGQSKFFGHNIRKDATDLPETLRRIALGVINAIHDDMDTVDGSGDV